MYIQYFQHILRCSGLTRRADVTCSPEDSDGSSLRTRGLFWVWFKVKEKERLWVTGAERPRWRIWSMDLWGQEWERTKCWVSNSKIMRRRESKWPKTKGWDESEQDYVPSGQNKLNSTVSGLSSVAYYISIGALCWGCCRISITGLFLSSPAGRGSNEERQLDFEQNHLNDEKRSLCFLPEGMCMFEVLVWNKCSCTAFVVKAWTSRLGIHVHFW